MPRGATDSVRAALRQMSREQRCKALLGLCLRLAEIGWRHYRGRNWKDALRGSGRHA